MRLVVGLALWLAAAALAAPAAAATRGAVGQAFVAPAAAGFRVGRDQGISTRHGLAVAITEIQGSTPAVQALLAGSLHVVLGAPARGLLALAAGADLVSVTRLGSHMAHVLVARPEIRTPAALRGKRLGTSGAGPSTDRLALLLALKRSGLDPRRDGIAFVVPGTQSQRVQALAAGRVDAPVNDPLQGAIATRLGMVTPLALSTLAIPWDHDVVLIDRQLTRTQPALVEALLEGPVAANAFVLDPAHKAAGLPTLERGLGLERDGDVEPACSLTTTLYVGRTPYPAPAAARALVEAARGEFPQLAKVALEQHDDSSLVRKLDESGSIDRRGR
jgi:ABC-type nitrate/sulfonate/bicarbonate transport system substrate-binding protein